MVAYDHWYIVQFIIPPLLLVKSASKKSGRTVKKADQYKNRHYGRFFYGVKKAPLGGALFTLRFGGKIANFE